MPLIKWCALITNTIAVVANIKLYTFLSIRLSIIMYTGHQHTFGAEEGTLLSIFVNLFSKSVNFPIMESNFLSITISRSCKQNGLFLCGLK